MTTFSSSSVTRHGIRVLQEQAAGDMLYHGAGRSGTNLDKAQVLLCGETFARIGREGWSGDSFDKQLCNLFGRGTVDLAIDTDNSTESRDRVTGQRFLISLMHVLPRGCSTGIGVLDDDDRGLVELLRKFPAGVEIDEIVEAEFLALQLRCACDTET